MIRFCERVRRCTASSRRYLVCFDRHSRMFKSLICMIGVFRLKLACYVPLLLPLAVIGIVEMGALVTIDVVTAVSLFVSTFIN